MSFFLPWHRHGLALRIKEIHHWARHDSSTGSCSPLPTNAASFTNGSAFIPGDEMRLV